MKIVFALVLGFLLSVAGVAANAASYTSHEQDHVSNPNGGSPCCRDIVTTTYYHLDRMGNRIIDGWTVNISVDCGSGFSSPGTYKPDVVLSADQSSVLSAQLIFVSGTPTPYAGGTDEIDALNRDVLNKHWHDMP